ncbi:unnamed protein product [Aphis gossypii]|uniref:Uncharacterized protein n=1 Tax=Aphis gossypii TaxID=80765 RepID=A0A9P0IT69_APHGO|nr:unnamed protein product [Aphis gossypii]
MLFSTTHFTHLRTHTHEARRRRVQILEPPCFQRLPASSAADLDACTLLLFTSDSQLWPIGAPRSSTAQFSLEAAVLLLRIGGPHRHIGFLPTTHIIVTVGSERIVCPPSLYPYIPNPLYRAKFFSSFF